MKKSKVVHPKKDRNVYPAGLDLRRTRAIADYYDARKDQPVMERPLAKASEMAVWMEVPPALVAQVRKLIARQRKSA